MRIGFLGLLGLLFIGLKLGGCIAWSWWWVLLPLYCPIAIWLGIVVGAVFGACCIGFIEEFHRGK